MLWDRLLHYRHFYGSYDYLDTGCRRYRREVPIVRNDKRIRSYRDAQGFRTGGANTTGILPQPKCDFNIGQNAITSRAVKTETRSSIAT